VGTVAELDFRVGLLVVAHGAWPVGIGLDRHFVVEQVGGAVHVGALFLSRGAFFELAADLHRGRDAIDLAGLPLALQRVKRLVVVGVGGKGDRLGKWQKAQKQGNRCFHGSPEEISN
jgi:hypothetical protein